MLARSLADLTDPTGSIRLSQAGDRAIARLPASINCSTDLSPNDAARIIASAGHTERLAHLLCEQYYRARKGRLNDGTSCRLPLNQTQLAKMLGMSLVSVNRAFQALRRRDLVDFQSGQLTIHKWSELSSIATFDPLYLHVTKDEGISTTPFKGRRQ